jgi:hypothetical protein
MRDSHLGLRIVPFTSGEARLVPEVRRAARRERQRLSLADCCCLATVSTWTCRSRAAIKPGESLRLGIDVHPIR